MFFNFCCFYVLTVKNFPCVSCDQIISDEKTLRKHMKSKHVHRSIEKKWACTECDYSTDLICDYRRHFVTHSKVKAYKCDTCGKSFTQKFNFTRHIKSVHTKESNMSGKFVIKYLRDDILYLIILKLFTIRFVFCLYSMW